ncbi:MAG: MNIO family bufferin maturase [Steroidobacteraceae bacterium]
MSPTGSIRPIPAQAGIGLRLPHQALVQAEHPRAAWLEVHPENYMSDAHSLAELERIRTHYPLSLHAVGLSLGSAQGVDAAHIERLRRLVLQLEPCFVSDHLSWSVAGGHYLPDLLPLPYTDEALHIVCRNVTQVQEALGRQILVENPSTYLQFSASSMPEAEFLAAVAKRTGCGVLFDVNNIYVSASNQQLDAHTVLTGWCRALDARSVLEMHLAGHAVTATAAGGELRIDDHGDHVCAAVWALYEQALAHFGPRPTLLEWDTRLPAFSVLQAEAALAQDRIDGARQHSTARESYARAV